MLRTPRPASKDRRKRYFKIENPLIVAYRFDGDEIATRVYPDAAATPQFYGCLIARLVREVTEVMDVTDDVIWEAIEEERNNPTIVYFKPN